jgi:hypothetical protein
MYLDPGGLSYFIQFLIAGVLAAFFWFKNLRDMITRFFTKTKKDEMDDQ